MDKVDVNDIQVTPLSKVKREGGDIFHLLKSSDVGFNGFGEAYISWIDSGKVKAWKRHLRMTMNLIVPHGSVRFVFLNLDSNGIRDMRIEEIGIQNYKRITVPAGIWFGFQGRSLHSSLVLNIANILHEPTEADHLPVESVDFSWGNN